MIWTDPAGRPPFEIPRELHSISVPWNLMFGCIGSLGWLPTSQASALAPFVLSASHHALANVYGFRLESWVRPSASLLVGVI